MLYNDPQNTVVCEDCGSRMGIQACKSYAGYYVGRFCPECGPSGRFSEYFGTRTEAHQEMTRMDTFVQVI